MLQVNGLCLLVFDGLRLIIFQLKAPIIIVAIVLGDALLMDMYIDSRSFCSIVWLIMWLLVVKSRTDSHGSPFLI